MQEWRSAVVGACGSTLKPREEGLVAGDAPPDFKCGQGIPRLGVSRVSIIDSGKDVSFTTGWDGSESPLGTVSIQRGGGEDCALNPGDREFPAISAESNAGGHPHATGVSTEQDVVGNSLRGEQQHENLRAKKEIINMQVGIDHSRLSDDHILLEAFLEFMRCCELRYG